MAELKYKRILLKLSGEALAGNKQSPIDSEIVGKNFLNMLTEPTQSAWLKESYDSLSSDQQAYFKPTIDKVAGDSDDFDFGENGKYALGWIKLCVESYNEQTDDGPISNTLVTDSAIDQSGILVYSKLRSIEESASVSKNNITVAAYQDDYEFICNYTFNIYNDLSWLFLKIVSNTTII